MYKIAYINNQIHIINREFVEKWKDYTNYHYIKKRKQFPYYYKDKQQEKIVFYENKHPGSINNQDLIIPMTLFYNDGDVNNQENYILRRNLDEARFVKYINELQWGFFTNKYEGGVKILKKDHNIIKVNILILPNKKEISKELIKSLEIRVLFFKEEPSVPISNSFISKLVDILNKISTYSLDATKIRIFKFKEGKGLEDLKEELTENCLNLRVNQGKTGRGQKNQERYEESRERRQEKACFC